MTDHETALGAGAAWADDPHLSPSGRMAALAAAYVMAREGGRDDAAPPPAADLHDLLVRAALEGRQPEPGDRGWHEPEPPTLRCQRCGRRIHIRWMDHYDGPDWRWVHDDE